MSRKESNRVSPPLTAFLFFALLAYLLLLIAAENKDSKEGYRN